MLKLTLLLCGVGLCGFAFTPSTIAAKNAKTKKTATINVIFQTSLGEIEIAVDPQHAPVTTNNFLRYVDEGFYNGGMFHRTVKAANQKNNPIKIAVIQASIDPAREKAGYPPIPLERTNKTGLRHVDGAISMARDGVDSATSDFFICIGNQPELDFGGKRNPDGQGFAAFGKVVRGLNIVRDIQQSPAQEQKLTPPIWIKKGVS